ncbi:MAG: Na-translocating system protein MpsC family protein [Solirubrobacteraceae bacterium]
MSGLGARRGDCELTEAISAAIVQLYTTFYGHSRTTATTYLNGRVVVCVLESILTDREDALIAAGSRGEVIDGRIAFQTDTEDEFTAAIERLTHRRVTAFLSANQTTPGVACELFFLDAAPLVSTTKPTLNGSQPNQRDADA